MPQNQNKDYIINKKFTRFATDLGSVVSHNIVSAAGVSIPCRDSQSYDQPVFF